MARLLPEMAATLALTGLSWVALGTPVRADDSGWAAPPVVIEEVDARPPASETKLPPPVVRGRPSWRSGTGVRMGIGSSPANEAKPVQASVKSSESESRGVDQPVHAVATSTQLPATGRATMATLDYGDPNSNVAPVTVDLKDPATARPTLATANVERRSIGSFSTDEPNVPNTTPTKIAISAPAAPALAPAGPPALAAVPMPRVGPFIPGPDGRLQRHALAPKRMTIGNDRQPIDGSLGDLAAAIASSLECKTAKAAEPASAPPAELELPAAKPLPVPMVEFPTPPVVVIKDEEEERGFLVADPISSHDPRSTATPLQLNRPLPLASQKLQLTDEPAVKAELAGPVRTRVATRSLDFQPTPVEQPAVDEDDDFKPLSAVRTNIAPSAGELPEDLAGKRFQDAGEYYQTMGYSRFGAEVLMNWEAVALCHRPLLFEEVNLERHGYRVPLVQPFFSAAHFFGRVPALPYLLVSEKYRTCNYTLGHYRPGSCAPYVWYYPRFSLDGATFETLLVAGLIYVIP